MPVHGSCVPEAAASGFSASCVQQIAGDFKASPNISSIFDPAAHLLTIGREFIFRGTEPANGPSVAHDKAREFFAGWEIYARQTLCGRRDIERLSFTDYACTGNNGHAGRR
ncbi:hypothetical protein KM043_011221 [Ampulex compressa]|nr:hypothetical protein KM043_011221 [Ampulex compressa]